jgi:hypothetical protein
MKTTKIVSLILFFLFLALFISGCSSSGTDTEQLAKCLSEKGAKMYGAFWCGHCQDQKAMFGDDWQYVSYVECSTMNYQQTEECKQAGITGYPTWEFGDGSRKSGALSFEQLKEKSGCE